MESIDLQRPQAKASPRPNRPSKTKTKEKLSRDQLLLALEKKKLCNAKALAVVEYCIDSVERESDFIEKLKDINQVHYDDIVEERSIVHLCGYPLCKKPLTDVPTKQYHISKLSNKIYDITERKKFCCTDCFRASKYIKEQLLTSPLWLRDHEDIPAFHILTQEQCKNDDKNSDELLPAVFSSLQIKQECI